MKKFLFIFAVLLLPVFMSAQETSQGMSRGQSKGQAPSKVMSRAYRGQTPKIIKKFQKSAALEFCCTVQEIYSEKTTKTLLDLAKESKQLGIKVLPDIFEAGARKGKAGFGFIYIGAKNRNYIITNRHTVENGDSYVITYTDSDGKTTEYKDVSLVSVSYEYDLAVLAFPPKVRPFKKGADFSASYGKDIEKFLSGEALNFFESPDDDYFEDEEFEDEDEFLSLLFPVPSITEIAAFAESGKYVVESENPGVEVYETAIEFGECIGYEENDFLAVLPYVSKRIAQDYGKQIFLDVVKRCPYTDWEIISLAFSDLSAMEGLRYVIAWYAFTGYNRLDFGKKGQRGHTNRKTIPVEIQPPDVKPNTEDWNVIYNLPAKHSHAVTSWTFEYGRWRLLSFKMGGAEYSINSDDFNHLGSISLYQPSAYVLSNGVENSLLRDTSYFTEYLDFEVRMLNWLSVDSTIKACSYNSPMYHQGSGLIGGVFENVELQAGAKFLMPMYFKYVIFSPYASTKLGARIGGFSEGLYFDLTASADAVLRSTWFIRRWGLTVFEDTGVKINLDSVIRQNPEGKRFTPNVCLLIGFGVGY